MDLARRRKLYAACTDEPLAPEDPRNVDFDHRSEPVRGVPWVERLAGPIELSLKPTRQLITGLPGSGKSTELRRLEVHLRGIGILVARVDAEDAFDLTQPIDLPDIIAVLVDAAEKALQRESVLEPRSDGFLVRVWSWLSESEVELKEVELNGGPARLAFEMKTRSDFRQRIRASITRHFSRFLEDARQELTNLDAKAKDAGWQGLCLILDSLEKLRGLDANWQEVLESAVRVFGSGAPYLALPVHCVFTVPPALVYRLNADVEFMPMIKLHDRDGQRFLDGFSGLREMVRRRLADGDLAEILGPDFEALLDGLIARSGGYPREVVLALRWLIELRRPATAADLRRLHNEDLDRLQSVVTDEEVPWLARVAVSKKLPVPNDDERPMVDRAIQNHLVLRYLNDHAWYDLHPAALDIPEIRAAIDALRHGK